MARKRIFKIMFTSQGKVYEIYARKVDHGTLYGFVEVEELLFGEKSTLLVDPAEEQLKLEFSGVNRTYIPFHSVIRIDEVDKEGSGKVLHLANQGGANGQLPQPMPIPDRGPAKS
jgi:hypothetical protein